MEDKSPQKKKKKLCSLKTQWFGGEVCPVTAEHTGLRPPAGKPKVLEPVRAINPTEKV